MIHIFHEKTRYYFWAWAGELSVVYTIHSFPLRLVVHCLRAPLGTYAALLGKLTFITSVSIAVSDFGVFYTIHHGSNKFDGRFMVRYLDVCHRQCEW